MLSDTATVNSVQVRADGKPYEAYPAIYTASVKNTQWVEAQPVKINPDNNQVSFTYSPTPAVKDAVQKALNSAVDEVVKHPTEKDGYEWLDTGWSSYVYTVSGNLVLPLSILKCENAKRVDN